MTSIVQGESVVAKGKKESQKQKVLQMLKKQKKKKPGIELVKVRVK